MEVFVIIILFLYELQDYRLISVYDIVFDCITAERKTNPISEHSFLSNQKQPTWYQL